VALATTRRSPYSWVSSFRYGVSPQPAQAPENSNSGSSICEPLIDATLTCVRSNSGISRKKSQLARSRSRWSRRGAMSMDLCLTSVLERAGQTSTQVPQPVQSSGAT
jgi:hypothetical protein